MDYEPKIKVWGRKYDISASLISFPVKKYVLLVDTSFIVRTLL